MFQCLFLDRLAHEKFEELGRRGPLPRVAPEDFENLVGMLVPHVGLGIVEVHLSPTVAGLIELVDFRRGPSMLSSRRPATDVPR
jgi:hypothetical protein